MIFGVGTDIIEVARMESALKRTAGLKDKLFSSEEQAYCEGHGITYQHYAARFSAKEAFLKALGTGYREGLEFSDINVKNDALGKPYIEMSGLTQQKCEELGIKSIFLSLSHIKETAIAFVVLEK